MTDATWENARTMMREMPAAEALRLARRMARSTPIDQPQLRSWWRRIYWHMGDIYAALVSGVEPSAPPPSASVSLGGRK